MSLKNIIPTGLVALFVLTLFSCGQSDKKPSAEWPLMSVQIDTLFTLGEDSTSFLIRPQGIVTDSLGRVFVADIGQNSILVFSTTGEFLYRIGREGRGPAEFTQMAGFSIDSDDILIVFDRAAQLLKTFHTNGEFIESIDLGFAIDSRVKFAQWNDKRILYYLESGFKPTSIDRDYLHFFSSDYQLMGNGVNQRELDPSGKDLFLSFAVFLGNYTVTGDAMYYVPFNFAGELFKYRLSEQDGEVHAEPEGRIESYVHKRETGKKLSTSGKPSYSDIRGSSGGEVTYYISYNKSAGLFELNDGKIVHFTVIEHTDDITRTFGVELYSPDLSPAGYGTIVDYHRAEDTEYNNRAWSVEWKDADDNFYAFDRTPQQVARIVKIRLNFDLDEAD